MPELAPDTVLQNRYRILKKINKGGVGIVYKAHDDVLSCYVTVKNNYLQGDKDDESMSLEFKEELSNAFKSEARLLANIRHPMIPRVIDYFEEVGTHYLVMDFIEGDDLLQQLEKRGRRPFNIEDVAIWADNLLEILEKLHSNDPPIIHRDIKPDNIKISPQNTVVLLDFGLAKGSAGTMSYVTTTWITGASQWSPPEQVIDDETNKIEIDCQSDLYALAATLWTLLTGKLPPRANNRERALLKNEKDPLELASKFNSHVSTAISEILNKAMEIEKKNRFKSAKEMRLALTAAFDIPRVAAEEKHKLEAEKKLRQIIEKELRDILWNENERIRETARRELSEAKKYYDEKIEKMGLIVNPALEEVKRWKSKAEQAISENDELKEVYVTEIETLKFENEKLKKTINTSTDNSKGINFELQKDIEEQGENHPLVKKFLTDAHERWKEQQIKDNTQTDELNPESQIDEVESGNNKTDSDYDEEEHSSLLRGVMEDLRSWKEKTKTWFVKTKIYNPPEPPQTPTHTKNIKRHFVRNLVLITTIAFVLIVSGFVIYKVIRVIDLARNNNAQQQDNNFKTLAEKPPDGMVKIRGGSFKMGYNKGQQDEQPEHTETVEGFYIDRTEVTQQQYNQYITTNGYPPPLDWEDGKMPIGKENYPITGITWNDAVKYCESQGKRLPDEKEWEFAARCGEKNFLYPWGNEWKEGFANVQNTVLLPVNEFQKEELCFGILGMIGNASEWTDSNYSSLGYGRGKEDVNLKVVRGGSCCIAPYQPRATYRDYYQFNKSTQEIGFRCVKEVR